MSKTIPMSKNKPNVEPLWCPSPNPPSTSLFFAIRNLASSPRTTQYFSPYVKFYPTHDIIVDG